MEHPLKKILSFIIPSSEGKFKGKFLPQIEVNINNGKVHIDGSDVNYSFGSLHYVFRKAIKKFKKKILFSPEVLVLGFGAGSIAQILLKELNYSGHIIGVDAEPMMFQLAKKYGGIDSWSQINIVIDKAENYIFNNEKRHECILIDVFIEDRIPEALLTSSFVDQLKCRVQKLNIVLWNCLQKTEDYSTLSDLLRNHEHLEFQELKVSKNNVVMCIQFLEC